MPPRNFVCELCGWTTVQYAPNIAHPCLKNRGELVELVCIDKTSPVDICCDGCDAERPGVEHHAYSDKVARESARAAGWECDPKKGDWCPRCVANKAALSDRRI
jgi:hypothetical protein